jgi:hypothetical protein
MRYSAAGTNHGGCGTNTRRRIDSGSKEGDQKTLRAKVLGGSLGNSTSSLAVFYVEQVALNRHVSPLPQRLFLCLKSRAKSRSLNFANFTGLPEWLEPFRNFHA